MSYESYDSYIRRKLKEEREMPNWLDNLRPPAQVNEICCEYCKQKVPQPFYVVKHFGRATQQFPFCDEMCSQLYYLKHLRKEGL